MNGKEAEKENGGERGMSGYASSGSMADYANFPMPNDPDDPLPFTPQPPPDKYGMVWFIMMLLGVGLLFPWNALLTASDYFTHIYPDFAFMFALSLAYNYPQVVFLFLTVGLGPRFSFTSRIVIGFAVDVVVQILVPVINLGEVPKYAALSITLGGVFFTGCATAVLFGTVLGLASLLPPKYITAVMSGNGVAGILAGLLRIITKLALPNDLKISALIYFAISGFILFLCIIAYFVLLRLPYAQFYLHQAELKRQTKQLSVQEAEAVLGGSSDPLAYDGDEEKSKLLDPSASSIGARKKIDYLSLMGRIWKDAFVVLMIFFVTLALFPGMTLEIETTTSLGQDWFGILLIFTFQVFDFVGRTLPQWFILCSARWLWIPTLLRLVFFPLFILCIKPVIFHHDAWTYSFMFLFAITNGYFGTLAMMFGPSNAKEHEKETAGIAMSFFLNLGIFLAAHFAILLLYLVKHQLPWPVRSGVM